MNQFIASWHMLHMLGYVTMFVPISWEIADVVLMLYSEIMAMHPLGGPSGATALCQFKKGWILRIQWMEILHIPHCESR